MKDAKGNNKRQKPKTIKQEQTRLRQLLNELHQDETPEVSAGSRQRAEDILNLIRSRTAESRAKKFLDHFFDYISKKI
jgi:hypothetical protein